MIANYYRLLLITLQLLLVQQLGATGNPTVKYIGIEHGLSNNSVLCIYQDYKGFMWFGTYDGLNRYDGYNFTVFRNSIGDSTSLNCNEIYSIAGDKNHNIWIGGRKGVSVYDPVSNLFSPASYIPFGQKRSATIKGSSSNIITDEQGYIFVPTDQDGFVVFDPGSKLGRQAPLLINGKLSSAYRVNAIESGKTSNTAWLIIQQVGLCRYDKNTKTIRVVNASIKQGNCLKDDGLGNIWIGTDNGLYRYNIQGNICSENLSSPNYKISCICIDQKGIIWVGSDGNGLLQVPAGSQRLEPFLSQDGKPLINSVAVYAINEDNQGRKWVGTLRGGVNIVESVQNPFKTIFYGDQKTLNPNNNFVQAFCEDESNNLWIGTGGGGLRHWNRSRNSYTAYTHDPAVPGSVGGNFITGIAMDVKRDIWVSSWFGGISRFNKATNGFVHYPCYNPYTKTQETKAWLVYEDKQKRLWCSTSNDGTLYQLDRKQDRFFVFDSSLVNIQCMAEDKNGNIWGGNYNSLVKIDPLSKKHRYYPVGYTIRAIHEDKRGNLWVGTQGGGLLLFNKETGSYKRFHEANGLSGNTILRILEDKKGDLWMSSFIGLVHMDTRTQKFRYYAQSDGLQSNQFTFNAGIMLQSGEYVFGGLRGFNIFYPDSIHTQADFPSLLLTAFRIAGQPIHSASSFITKRTMENIQHITIPYDSATLSVDFVALEYSFPDKVQYSYYLEGWDKSWNHTGQVRTANYNHLHEGDYTLRVKSTNAEGVWNKSEAIVLVTVLPPWFRSWWAYLGYFAAVAGLIYVFLMYKNHQTKLKYEVKIAHLEAEKEKELTEKKISFFTHIAHEFRTPLTLIINPLKDLVGKNKLEEEQGISMIYRNAKRLLSLADQLLLFRKVDAIDEQLRIERLDLSALCNEVFLSFSQYEPTRKTVFTISGTGYEIPVYGDREKIEIILFNLVSNAFKYTPAGGAIELILAEQDRTVSIIVKDNGSGIPAEIGNRLFESFYQFKEKATTVQPGFGIGLYVSKKLALAHEGDLFYSANVAKGTSFTLLLQKGKAHFGNRPISEDHSKGKTIFTELMENNLETEAQLLPVTGLSKSAAAIDHLTSALPSMLIVDDNDEMRSYIKKIFQDSYTIHEADDGASGYQVVVSVIPDIVISDVMMKTMSGVELCRKIKEHPSLAHIPVVLLTAGSSEAVQLQGIEGGAEDYIIKPFDKDIIMARVKSILKGRNHLHQFYYNAVTLKPELHVAGEHKDFFEKCIRIIEDHLDDPTFTIQVFCREIGMSHPSLYKKVKAISGQTINVFIRHIRLKKAAELLINTNKTIVEVTYLTGFNDIKYFREQFQKLFDINPSEYVKRYRKVLGKKTGEI